MKTLTAVAKRDVVRRLITPKHESIRKLSDLSQDLVAQIEHFFVSYNEIKGKQFEVKGPAGSKRALALVTAAMKKRRRR